MTADDDPLPNVANHGTMKSQNIGAFMKALLRHAPISRADISRLTGLDKKCVSMFSHELLAAGFIREAGMAAVSRGRPGWLLDFVPARNYSLGISVQADRINSAVFEFPGKLVHTAALPIGVSISLGELSAAIENIAAGLSRLVDRVAGIGVSFPGVMDLRQGIIHTSAHIPCLDKFRYRERLGRLGSQPTNFDQSSRIAALAETWFGQGTETGNLVCIDLNIGISMVAVNKYGIYHGPDGFVGELGHIVVQPHGKRCRCGNLGCLEAYLGKLALDAQLRESGIDPEMLFPFDSSQPIVPASALPAKAIAVLKNAGAWLGRGIGTVVNLFSPDKVLIQGDLMRYSDLVLPSAHKELAKYCLADRLRDTSIAASTLAHPDTMGVAALSFPGWFDIGAAK